MAPSSNEIARARAIVAEAASVVVLSGAGLSADSGVPTFRGEDGLWKNFRPEELASPSAFARDPRLVWEWYGWRREKVAVCQTNAGHRALARFSLAHPDCLIVTQNVDGLHELAAREAAGKKDPSKAMPIALHGHIFSSRCTACAAKWSDRNSIDASDVDHLPSCPSCGALARPDIVWFGESLEEDLLHRAFSQAQSASLCLVIGTAGVVQPAASIAAVTAEAGGQVIEVNPSPSALSPLCTISFRATAASILPDLLDF